MNTPERQARRDVSSDPSTATAYPIHNAEELDCARRSGSVQRLQAHVARRMALAVARVTMVALVGSAYADDGARALTVALSQLGAGQITLAQAAQTQQQGNSGEASQPQPQSLGGALGGLLNAMGGALGGNQHITPVDFRTLQALLPDSLPGMKRANAGGANKHGMGVKTASAEAEYRGSGNQVIHVSISDISGISGVLDMYDALPKDTDAASDEGYEKDVTIGGRPMHEKYTRAGQQSSLQAIIARRFEVDVDGTSVGMDAVHLAMGQIDLKRLEAMKSQGVQN
jgi:hypothetical protein